MEVFCPVAECNHRTPYKIPGFLVNHLINNHCDQFDGKEMAKAKVDVLFAQEMQATLSRGVQPIIQEERILYEELEDGEIYEEIEEMSGSVFGATLPFVGIQPEPMNVTTARSATPTHMPPPARPTISRRRASSDHWHPHPHPHPHQLHNL